MGIIKHLFGQRHVQHHIYFVSAKNISLGLRPRPIFLPRQNKYNVGRGVIQQVYNVCIAYTIEPQLSMFALLTLSMFTLLTLSMFALLTLSSHNYQCLHCLHYRTKNSPFVHLHKILLFKTFCRLSSMYKLERREVS